MLVLWWGEHLYSDRLTVTAVHMLYVLWFLTVQCCVFTKVCEQALNQITTQCLKQETALISLDLFYYSCLVNECLHNSKLRTLPYSRNMPLSTDVCYTEFFSSNLH